MPGHLEIAGEEDGEEAVLHKVKRLDRAGRNDRTVRHVRRDVRLLGKLEVPDEEAQEGDDAHHEHGDERALLPSPGVERARERHGDQNQRQARDQQDQAEEVDFRPDKVKHLLPQGAIGRAARHAGEALGHEAVLLGAALEDDHGGDERHGHERRDDGPGAVRPSPAGVVEEALPDHGAEVQRGDRGDGLGQRGPERAVDEVRGVGDEHLLRQAEAGGANGVEEAGGLSSGRQRVEDVQ